MRRRLLIAFALLAAVPGAAAADAPDARDARRALDRAERLLDGRGVRTGRELTPVLAELARNRRALPREARADAADVLARPAGPPGTGEEDYSETPERHCTAHFCIHWVDTPGNPDAVPPADVDSDGVPDYVETTAADFEFVHLRVTGAGGLAWQQPPGDGAQGEETPPTGTGRTDVYLKELLSSESFGYASPDGGSRRPPSYLVLDNNYEEFAPLDPVKARRVTAAHEFHHAVQFGYDGWADGWLFESSAVWMEDEVYDDVDDYLRYLPGWSARSTTPLIHFGSTGGKVYGSAVWHTWLAGRYGADIVRGTWERSVSSRPTGFSAAATDAAIQAVGGGGMADELGRFSAGAAEWRTPSSGWPEGASFPDLQRLGQLPPDGPGASTRIGRTGFALFDVPAASAPASRLIVTLPAGEPAAVALVGRIGSEATGSIESRFVAAPQGGRAIVTFDRPLGDFSRVTAVIAATGALPEETESWELARDGVQVAARVSTDLTAPSLTDRFPPPDSANAPTDAPLHAAFSEPLTWGPTARITLADARGRAVRARVRPDADGRGVTLDPDEPLADTTTHRVQIGGEIVDAGENTLPAASWTFRTARRAPVVRLGGVRRQKRAIVARRGLHVSLRSSDRDALGYTLRLSDAAGHRVGVARTGSLSPGKSRAMRLRLRRSARTRVRSGRLRVVRVSLGARDPQGNRRTARSTVRLRR